nr:predicted GPI-anchored protein 58 [Setaria viridis]
MCELLKHGAKPSDDIIQLSSVIRMCALSLVYLREPQSIASAAAMVPNTVRTAATSGHPDALPEEGASSQASVEDTPKPKPNKPDALPEEGAGSQASVEDSPKPKPNKPDALPEEGAGSQASVEDSPKPKPNKPDAVPEEGAGSQASVEDSPNPKRQPNPNKT